MTLDVLGLDHIYITVSDLARSTAFYDDVMRLLGFRKGTDSVGGQPHVHYFNRALQYTLRPAKSDAPAHDQLNPGLHHLCFQMVPAHGLLQFRVAHGWGPLCEFLGVRKPDEPFPRRNVRGDFLASAPDWAVKVMRENKEKR